MSKTVELQIEKSRHLIEGLRKHLGGIGGGVTNDEIGQMEQSLKTLETANAEVDRLREELTPKVKQMNEVLARVKEAYADKKKMLKGLLPSGALGRLRHPRQTITRLSLAKQNIKKSRLVQIFLRYLCLLNISFIVSGSSGRMVGSFRLFTMCIVPCLYFWKCSVLMWL